MTNDWPEVTVRDLVDAGVLERPIDGNHGELHPKGSDFVTHGIPFIMASDLIGGRVDTQQCAFITEEQARSLRKGFVYPGDLLISHKATMGRTAIVHELDVPFLMLTPQVTYYRIRDTSKLDRRFLKYYFDSPGFQNLFSTWGHKGSTRAYLGITSQLDLPIILPPIDVQRAIAHILGTLDDKIELNRRMSVTLESTARAVFKSWFVDFDPVIDKALRAGNPIPSVLAEKAVSRRGMLARAKSEGRESYFPKHITALFPDRFMDSDIGPIPAGWRVVSLPDMVDINPPRILKKGEVAPYLDMANMPTICHMPDAVIERSFGSGMRFINGDTLVARITPCLENGKTAYVDFLANGQVGWGSTEYIVLRPKPPLPSEFGYCLARSTEFREFAIQSMTGTSGRQRVPPAALFHYQLARPSELISLQFGKVVQPLFARANQVARESSILAALRDVVLPKLISGELRLAEAKRFIKKDVGC